MTISLSSQVMREMERVRKAERRTRSELIQDALRSYFSRRIPVREASSAERRALQKGRAEFSRGAYLSLNALQYALGPRRRPASRKTA